MKQPFTPRAISVLSAMAFLASTTVAFAGTTPWLDRDNPGGTGDWENTTAMVSKVECEIIATGQSTAGMPGYICTTDGSICTNTAALACQDTRLRLTFDDKLGHSATTPWLNRDTQTGTGDWELTSQLVKVECKFTDDGTPVTTQGAYRCGTPDSRAGGSAVNAQNGGKPVRNIAVRYSF